MTVFNAEKHLQETLNTLSDQDYLDFEVVVLEHGSSDSSLEILMKWRDPRLKLETLTRNIGRTSALNNCLMRARGEYIAVLDADDLAHKSRVSAQVNFLEENPQIGLVGTWSKHIDEDGCEVGSYCPPTSHDLILAAFATSNPFTHSSICARRDLMFAVGSYNEAYRYAQDFKLCLELAVVAQVAILPHFYCSWRRTVSSLTNSEATAIDRKFEEAIIFKEMSKKLNFSGRTRVRNCIHRWLTRVMLFKEVAMRGRPKLACLTLISLRESHVLYQRERELQQ